MYLNDFNIVFWQLLVRSNPSITSSNFGHYKIEFVDVLQLIVTKIIIFMLLKL